VQPIFAGGRIRSHVKFTEARQQEAVLTYQQTIQQAFRGVSEALVEYRKDREFREQQEQLAFSAQDAAPALDLKPCARLLFERLVARLPCSRGSLKTPW